VFAPSSPGVGAFLFPGAASAKKECGVLNAINRNRYPPMGKLLSIKEMTFKFALCPPGHTLK
jgi:hypothetical protein